MTDLLGGGNMEPFFDTIITFPTIVFTIILLLCVFYWIFVILGIFDIDALDVDAPDIDADFDIDGSHVDGHGFLAGLLMKMGLNGVPFTIVLTVLSFTGWVLSFLIVLLVIPKMPGEILQFLSSLISFFIVFFASCVLTAKLIKPLKPVFQAMNTEQKIDLIGKIGQVRTSKVDSTFGEAFVEDGGAGLIIKVRSVEGEEFQKNDRVVLLSFDSEEGAYTVASANN